MARAKTPGNAVPVKYSTTKLGGGVGQNGVSFPGGLDQTTPSLALQPGALRDSLNFECAQSGGYARIQGYERFDGRAAPSDAAYQVIEVVTFVNVPTVGQVVTQANSGASGKIIAVVNVPGGLGSYIAVTQVTGSFNSSDVLTTSGPVTVGTATPLMISISAQLNAQYLAAAADVYRALIGAVPGSGAILGVVAMIFSNVDYVYAFRANANNTAVNLYVSSGTGWTQVPFFNVVNFTSGGTAVPLDGDTLTQSGVTATIKRVMWQSGAWSGSAVGAFVITNPAGGNFTSGSATTTSGAAVTLSGIQTAITLTPGGKFEFTKCNFSGQAITRRIYGSDGVNKCFEFDGTTLAPITTGLSPDSPKHITFHKNYLIVSQGSSLIGCGAGTPFKWDSIDGGWEIATGDEVTCMLTLPGSQSTATLGVYLRNNTSFLYGTDPTTFNYVSFNTGIGALEGSAQNLFDTFVCDLLGVITLRTTLNWGNFLPTSLTKNILPFIAQEREKISASSIMRSKSQYRLFFSDGYGLWVTMVNTQYLGSVPILFPNPVWVCDEEITTQAEEVTYFGSNDGQGYVYQMDVGTSFDGASIEAHFTTAWDPQGSPRILKRYRAASMEIQGSSYAEFQFGYQLGYGTPQIGQPSPVAQASNFASAPMWDSFTWDSFTWDGQTLSPSDVDVTGTAENIQVTISSTTNYVAAYTVDSIIHHFSMRRGIRV